VGGTAFRSTVRAQACDAARLPAATPYEHGDVRHRRTFEYLLTKMYSQGLEEVKAIAAAMHRELERLIPSFVKRAGPSEYLAAVERSARTLAGEIVTEAPAATDEPVRLVDWDEGAEEKILAAILYPHARHPLPQIRAMVAKLPPERREKILEEHLGRRRTRRDKPGRAFEQVYYTFDVLGNLGLYRDLHRHRILTQERQAFTTEHGYDTPPEIAEAGFKPQFDACMERAAALHDRIRRDLPQEAQYVVPFAYRVRWSVKLNLREAVHIGELRSMPQGHPDYRLIVQQMWRRISEVHPALARCAGFLDWKTYRLGRLQAELRTEYKKSLHKKSE
jgi:thymidylate synthase ThyX